MRAISLWQPWASLWCSAQKMHETRHWPTTYRGWLLVHAAKKVVKFDADLLSIVQEEFGWTDALARGAIVGAVNVVNCLRTDFLEFAPENAPNDFICGDFSPGRFAWERGAYKHFDAPIPFVGKQGFFHVPDELIPDRLGDGFKTYIGREVAA